MRRESTWLEKFARPLGGALLRGHLRAEERPTASLDLGTRERLFALYDAYYDRADRARFFRDLSEKDDVILLRDAADGSLQGFTTLSVYTHSVGGAPPVAILFSGDTVITPAYQRQRALHRAFVQYAIKTRLRYPTVPLYWFLISKGYKTYLLLSRNFVEYWPRHDRETPPEAQALIDTLATRRFGTAYRSELGIVRFEPRGARVRDEVAPLDAASATSPEQRLFLARNPGHADGDELACVGRLDLAMLVHFSRRVGRYGARKLLDVARRAPGKPGAGAS